jgi:hypothetical protein
MKKEPFSYIVPKKAQGTDGYLHPIYEARRELICVRCRRTIGKGEHFTKQRHPQLTYKNQKIYPCCEHCYPFTEIEPYGPIAVRSR